MRYRTLSPVSARRGGAAVGIAGIPREWLDGLWEWPRSVGWMQRLAEQAQAALTSNTALRPLTLPVYGVRNLLFLAIVLCHGFRRLLPPY